MPNRKIECCIRCKDEIQTNEGAVGISLFCQTVGMGKRRASKSERLYLCPECAVVAGMGEEPPKGQPLNIAAYRIVRYLIASDPVVVGEAYKQLSQAIAPLALPEGEILSPRPALRAAS